MTLLQQMEDRRQQQREQLRVELRGHLRQALAELIPGATAYIFGSLAKPGRFNEASDLDIALDSEPASMSVYQLTALLSERLGRPVDVVLLPECRFREKITREAERWTLPG
jgi:uncharacterized protein